MWESAKSDGRLAFFLYSACRRKGRGVFAFRPPLCGAAYVFVLIRQVGGGGGAGGGAGGGGGGGAGGARTTAARAAIFCNLGARKSAPRPLLPCKFS
ncbi:unnamed protein product, partial [Iphiclides podalirius]